MIAVDSLLGGGCLHLRLQRLLMLTKVAIDIKGTDANQVRRVRRSMIVVPLAFHSVPRLISYADKLPVSTSYVIGRRGALDSRFGRTPARCDCC